MYCANCGKEIREDAAFCPHCSADVEANMVQHDATADRETGVTDDGNSTSEEPTWMFMCLTCGEYYRGKRGETQICKKCNQEATDMGISEDQWFAYNPKQRHALIDRLRGIGVDDDDMTDAEREALPLEEEITSIVVTSSHHMEGYRITKYLDVISGACVLGTGFLSTISANWADFLGTSSTRYEEKLELAKRKAMQNLKTKAYVAGANAVIGVDIDYTTFSNDIMGVIANGTAVIIEPESN